MTPRELLEQAFSYLGEWGIGVGNIARGPLYQRMSARQRELFILANSIDPEFYGQCVVVLLDNGGADLSDLAEEEEIYPIESIQVVRIHEDPGVPEDPPDPAIPGYPVGTRVRLVRTHDTRELPPRMVLRNHILQGVGTDFDTVVSVKIWYSRRPHNIPMDGDGTVDLEEPHSVLLALDLAKYILSRDPALTTSAAMAHFTTLESQELELFKAHIGNAYRALEARFG